MRDVLNQLDTALFLLLNGLHAPWLDWLMVQFTARNTWIPFYALLIGWLGWRLGWRAVGVVLALVLVIVVSDQTCSAVLKPLTLRLRPCHETALQPLIHPVLPCGGLYGFASSHAANTIALAVFCWGLFGERYRAFGWLFPWAIVVAYSRIYVGAHYPLDVLAGAGIGAMAGLGGVSLYHTLAGAPLPLPR